VPDIRGQNSKEAQKTLAAVGLQLGDAQARCEDIGAQPAEKKLKRDQILCQSPAPGSAVERNTAVQIVLSGEADKRGG
jgi:beta-lactam-binding protein with PASTA domain